MSYWINAEWTFKMEQIGRCMPKIFDYKGIDLEWNQEDLDKYFEHYFEKIPYREYHPSMEYNRKELVLKLSIRCEQSTENNLKQYIALIRDISGDLCQNIPFNLRMNCKRKMDFVLKINGHYFMGGGLNFEMNLKSNIISFKKGTFDMRINGYGLVKNKMTRWYKFLDKYCTEVNISEL